MHFTKPLMFISILFFSFTVFASQTCDKSVEKINTDKIFIDNKDDTITDLRTGLMWKQCPYSKKRKEEARYIKRQGACSGRYYTFPHLNFLAAQQAASDSELAGYSDWRLPTIEEMEALTENACISGINEIFFPNHRNYTFWSSTEVPNSIFVRHYNFYAKQRGSAPKQGGLNVQFVRNIDIEEK